MGTPDFAVVSLKLLIENQINIAAVVTVPDKPRGRGQKVLPSPVKQCALDYDIPVLQPQKLKDPQFIAQLREFDADLFVVVAFRILPEEVFTMPPKGTVNLHGSLLPKYRGAAPINWAIINGESETGVTTFFIQKLVDTGNIIQKKSIAIGPDMTAGELHDQMAVTGAQVLLQTIRRIESGTVQASIQDESRVSKAPKIFREDCHVNFDQPVEQVHNLVRGLSPYPAAFAYLHDQQVKFYRCRIVNRDSGNKAAGTIISTENGELAVQCRSGQVGISEIQLQGKKRLPVAEFLRGYSLKAGDKFE